MKKLSIKDILNKKFTLKKIQQSISWSKIYGKDWTMIDETYVNDNDFKTNIGNIKKFVYTIAESYFHDCPHFYKYYGEDNDMAIVYQKSKLTQYEKEKLKTFYNLSIFKNTPIIGFFKE